MTYVILDCTVTPEGPEVLSREVRHWNSNPVSKGGRGRKQVGYTDLIHLDGKVERLVDNNEDAEVDSWEITNGAKGYNSVSRHIVYAGGLAKDGKTAKDTRTAAQLKAMTDYVRNFHERFPQIKIVGHRDLPGVNKACPSFDVAGWLKSIGIYQQ